MDYFIQSTKMRNCILISTLTFLLFAYNSKTDTKSTFVETADSSTMTLTNKKLEEFYIAIKGVEKFETIIALTYLYVQ